MRISNFFALASVASLIVLTSCFGDSKTDDFSEWRLQNEEYVANIEAETVDGKLVYERITPNWDQSVFVLMKWHNDREENINKLTPLSNSTVTLNYMLTTIMGDTIDKGTSFTCKPNNMVSGFWTAVTNMNVNDSVTVVVPYTAGYGSFGSGAVLPYSTLIFGIRLNSIDKLY